MKSKKYVADYAFYKNFVKGRLNLLVCHYPTMPESLMRPGTYVAIGEPFTQDNITGEISYKWDSKTPDATHWLPASCIPIHFCRYFMYIVNLNHEYNQQLKEHRIIYKISVHTKSEVDITKVKMGEEVQ